MRKTYSLAFAIILTINALAQENNRAVVVQNFYYPKPDQYQTALELRKEASAVRKKLGLVVGVILENTAPETGKPYLIWQAEYPSLQAREADTAKLSESEEFSTIQKKMSTLLDKFERMVWWKHTIEE